MRWMTYGEIATHRGISRQIAVRLVQRHKWQRRPVGDDTPLVQALVPEDKLTPTGHARTLRDEVAALRLQVARLAERLDSR